MKNETPAPARAKALRALRLFLYTVLAFALYRVLLSYAEKSDDTWPSFLVFIAYMALLLVFSLAYLIYNRFFYRQGVEKEDLPAEWDEEKKDAFLADAEKRKRASRWMLMLIFPLLFTFLLDALDIFIIDAFLRR